MRNVIEMSGIAPEPGIQNFLIRLMIIRVRPHVVLQNCAARHDEGEHYRSHAYRAHGRLLQPPPEKKHERRANRGQQRNQIDVVEKKHVSTQPSALSFRQNDNLAADS